MATPRCRIFDCTKPVTCHCISRCVRRIALLATEKRRSALRQRLEVLRQIFAIDIIEWALLPNHFHLILATHPDLANLWSDEEVARRWRTLSPDYDWRRRKRIAYTLPAQPEEIVAALEDPARIAKWRTNLADISTFHKFLKQRLARIINLEEEAPGHCFEGRFRSIVAEDGDAVIAHMVYVALNPVRASLADSLEDYDFCSIGSRVEELRQRIADGEFPEEVEAARAKLDAIVVRPALECDPGEEAPRKETLPDGRPNPWFGGRRPSMIRGEGQIGLVAYLRRVDSFGRVKRPEKRGVIAPSTPSPLAGLPNWGDAIPLTETPPTSGSRGDSTGLMIEAVETAMSRGLSNPIGHFSGGIETLARVARDSGRTFLVAAATGVPPGAHPGSPPGGRRQIAAAAEE